MISWRLPILFAVVFCSKVVFSCDIDSDCDNYGETCCNDDICRSECPNDGLSGAIIIIIVIFVIAFKVVFWVAICYCCRRRRYGGITFTRFSNAPTTVVVNSSSSQVHAANSHESNPVQHGYSPPQQIYTSPQQQGYNLPQQGYKPSQQGHVMVNPVSNPPPPYTDNP